MYTVSPPSELEARINGLEHLLMFDYDPVPEDTLLDLCKNDGNIIRKGMGPVTDVHYTDVEDRDLVLMVMAGDHSPAHPVQLRKLV